MLAWALALLAAAVSGGRRRGKGGKADEEGGESSGYAITGWLSRIAHSFLRNSELAIALSVAWVAGGELMRRSGRVTGQQVFIYGDPSFVAAADDEGERMASDVLTARAALVVLNHFLIMAWPLVAYPVMRAIQTQEREYTLPDCLKRACAVLVTVLWSVASSWKLAADVDVDISMNRGVGCLSPTTLATNIVRLYADLLVSLWWWQAMSVVIMFPVLLVGLSRLVDLLRKQQVPTLSEVAAWALGLVTWVVGCYGGVLVCALVVGLGMPLVVLGMTSGVAPWWYLTRSGRSCVFGPASSIGFGELDQIFFLVTGMIFSGNSIWRSFNGAVEWENKGRGPGYAQLPFSAVGRP